MKNSSIIVHSNNMSRLVHQHTNGFLINKQNLSMFFLPPPPHTHTHTHTHIKELSVLEQKEHKLKKKKFMMKIVHNSNDKISDETMTGYVLEVSGYNKTVSKEMLEIYFESKKAGGKEGSIKEVSILSEGRALLKFNDLEGL